MTFGRAMQIADDARAERHGDVQRAPLAIEMAEALSVLAYQVHQVIGDGEIGDTDTLTALVLDRSEFR